MAIASFFMFFKLAKTIVDHRTRIQRKPLKNHRCQWSICKKTFNGDGQEVAKPLKNHRWQWCPEEKALPSYRLKKMTIVEVQSPQSPPSPSGFYISCPLNRNRTDYGNRTCPGSKTSKKLVKLGKTSKKLVLKKRQRLITSTQFCFSHHHQVFVSFLLLLYIMPLYFILIHLLYSPQSKLSPLLSLLLILSQLDPHQSIR